MSVVYNISSSDDEDDDIQVIRVKKKADSPANQPSVTIIKTVETTVKTTSVVNEVKRIKPNLLACTLPPVKKNAKPIQSNSSPKVQFPGTNLKEEQFADKPLNKSPRIVEEIVLDESDDEIEWVFPNKVQSSPVTTVFSKRSPETPNSIGNSAADAETPPLKNKKLLLIDLSVDDDDDDDDDLNDVTIIEETKPVMQDLPGKIDDPSSTEGDPISLDLDRPDSRCRIDDVEKCTTPTSEFEKENTPSDATGSSVINDCAKTSQKCDLIEDDDEPMVGNVTESLLNKLISVIGEVGFNEDDKVKVVNKITKYYSSSETDFTQSKEFIDSVGKLISEIKQLIPQGRNKTMIVEEISQKVRAFLASLVRNSKKGSSKLRKLYSLYEKLNRRIDKLERAEVGIYSDSDSEDVYEMMCRYKARAVKVYSRICLLEGKADHADRLIKRQFQYRGPGPVPVTRALEKFVNKTRQFPNFQDVFQLVKRVNAEEQLGYAPAQVMSVAQEVFVKCGDELQRRRMHDERCTAYSYLPENSTDPAEHDVGLQEKLEKNRLIAKKEKEILAEFKERSEKEEPQEPDVGPNTEENESDDSDVNETETDAPTELFMDSEEEISYLGNVNEKRHKPGSPTNEPSAKKSKSDSKT